MPRERLFQPPLIVAGDPPVIPRPEVFAASNLAKVEAARQVDPIFELCGYCHNPRCAVRHILLVVKDYDQMVVPTLRRDGLICPVCRAPLEVQLILRSGKDEAAYLAARRHDDAADGRSPTTHEE